MLAEDHNFILRLAESNWNRSLDVRWNVTTIPNAVQNTIDYLYVR